MNDLRSIDQGPRPSGAICRAVPSAMGTYQLFCEFCQQYTNTTEPLVLFKGRNIQVRLSGICTKCNATKTKFLPRFVLDQIPVISRSPRSFKNNINYMNLYGQKIRLLPILNGVINDPSD